jgi:hypothetical protein
MKKILVLFLAMLITFAIPVGFTSFAEGSNFYSYRDFICILSDDSDSGTPPVIVGYAGNDTNIETPGMINGQAVYLYTLTNLDENNIPILPAEENVNKNITSAIIGDGTILIGSDVFRGNTNLRYVYIPDSVISIEDDAFDGCADNLIIIAPEGSYALDFAENHNLRFGSGHVEQGDYGYPIVYLGEPGKALTLETISGYQCSYTFSNGNCIIIIMGYIGSGEEIDEGRVIVTPDFDEVALNADDTLTIGTILGYWNEDETNFIANQDINNVIIGYGTKFISNHAFNGGQSLRNIYIPDTVIAIEEGTFDEHSDDLVIWGNAGSYAESYAYEHGIKFEVFDPDADYDDHADNQNQQDPINKTSYQETNNTDGKSTKNPATGVEGVTVAMVICTIALGGILISKKIR